MNYRSNILFLMNLNKCRNFINYLIIWEWNILKKLRRKSRRNILLRGFFLIFSLASILFCVFLPPIIIVNLLATIGIPKSMVVWTRIVCIFVWLWFISPPDKLSKKEREEKNKRKLDVVKAVEKARKAFDN